MNQCHYSSTLSHYPINPRKIKFLKISFFMQVSRMVSEGGRLLVAHQFHFHAPRFKFEKTSQTDNNQRGMVPSLASITTNKETTSSQWIHRTRRGLIFILQLMPARNCPPTPSFCRASPLVFSLASFSCFLEEELLELPQHRRETCILLAQHRLAQRR